MAKLSFQGPITKQTVYFNIYFPHGYDDSPTIRYPVAYRLHGMTDSRDTRNDLVTSNFEQSMRDGKTCPFIIVFPEADYNSFYADSKDGKKPVETQIIKELVPYIDANFRTNADRRARVVTGWSMGGFGVVEYMTKFPELWIAAVTHDGGIRDWVQMDAHLDVKQGIFGNDEAYYNKYSPFASLETSAEVVRKTIAVRLVVAHWTELNRPYRDLLISKGIPLSYVELGCDHVEECVVGQAGEDSWDFIFKALTKPIAM